MNVAYETVAFDVLNVSVIFTPVGALVKVIVSMFDMLGLHRVIADILKLIETPT